jgi:hypothetical protein
LKLALSSLDKIKALRQTRLKALEYTWIERLEMEDGKSLALY